MPTWIQPSLKVLADHIRACSFLIADGVIPGNEGRGYVLRRIIRRAIRHGYKLGARAAFFHKMVPDLVAEMGAAYPELAQNQHKVIATLKQEEDRFFETIEHGMAILDGELKALGEGGVFNGDTAFKLHDTYGFPLDLTQDICREHKITVDAAAFDAAMARQKEQARAAGKFKMSANLEYSGPATTFHGYDVLEYKANVLALYKDSVAVNQLNEGEMGVVVLDDTPFYAESGGQVGDRGALQSVHGIFAVEDTQKIQADRLRPPRRRQDRHHHRRQRRHCQGRRTGPPAHHAQPLGHPPAAQGAARSARRPCPAKGLAGRSGQDALRLRA